MCDSRRLEERLRALAPQLVAWRRELHQIPEPGMEEEETTAALSRILGEMHIPHRRLSPTGIEAYIGDARERAAIALRADIDGLLVTEETGLPFASRHPGRMHACGHDGHMAALLGAAALLREEEAELPGGVRLIFQPSEENTKGAKHLIAQGVLHGVEAIFGLHLFSDMERGQISLEAGPRMAQTDRFSITFHGKGGHAGKPHLCADATVMAAEFVMSLQAVVSREINPVDSAVATVGSLRSGTQYNVISGEAVLEGTCRSFSEKTARRLEDAIRARAEAIAAFHGGRAEIRYEFGSHPPLINPPELTAAVRESAETLFPELSWVLVPPLMLGEDFSCYQTKIPGAFAFVGCGKTDGSPCFPNHHPRFDMDEAALVDAVKLHYAAAHLAADKNCLEKERMRR